ncbi:MAG: DNA polymerase IV, partial [Chroococcidiopsidaceae cyanobacterium CP_BM_RX_35]|nr:DNA polymerase IV [Chroococcidiopsidaceae cyanobacterium CP_BM_RX_35]
SVEQRDEPQYRGRPLVVGASPEQRGVVAAASYEARKYGIHSAMPTRTACHRCRELLVVRPRFAVYREISEQIREIFSRYTDLVEPLALDEAYLDVTANKQGIPSATWIAEQIKESIFKETELTASAGISINKFLAKIASGMNKPNGLYLIPPDSAAEFVEQLPIQKFHGIGQVTAAKMQRLGIHSGADLKQWSLDELVKHFGKQGIFYYKIARAQDDRAVEPNQIRKSIGAETTFEKDLDDPLLMNVELEKLSQVVKERLDKHGSYGRTITLKVKYADFQQSTRSITVNYLLQEADAISTLAKSLLPATAASSKEVRLLGISISNLEGNNEGKDCFQLALEFKI